MMTSNFLLRFFLVIFASGIIFAIMIFGLLWLKARQFRKHAAISDICKFYIGEEKMVGRIIKRIGDQIHVEFLDSKNGPSSRVLHINELYPAW